MAAVFLSIINYFALCAAREIVCDINYKRITAFIGGAVKSLESLAILKPLHYEIANYFLIFTLSFELGPCIWLNFMEL
jgi:hypothetical protein